MRPPLGDELQRYAWRLLARQILKSQRMTTSVTIRGTSFRWMTSQHAARRLTVALLEDPDRIKLPSDIVMAASQLDGAPTTLRSFLA